MGIGEATRRWLGWGRDVEAELEPWEREVMEEEAIEGELEEWKSMSDTDR